VRLRYYIELCRQQLCCGALEYLDTTYDAIRIDIYIYIETDISSRPSARHATGARTPLTRTPPICSMAILNEVVFVLCHRIRDDDYYVDKFTGPPFLDVRCSAAPSVRPSEETRVSQSVRLSIIGWLSRRVVISLDISLPNNIG